MGLKRKKGSTDKDNKKRIVFENARELNDLVGMYIEENLIQIIDEYQNDVIDYILELTTLTKEDIKIKSKNTMLPGQLTMEECM